jgi:hypothetical protein
VKEKRTRPAGAPRMPESYTTTDNRRLEHPAYHAMVKRNPRTAVLLQQLDSMRWRGDPGKFRPGGGLEINGKLALSRKTVAPFMCKGAQSTAIADMIAAGFVRVTAPAQQPLLAARLLIVDDPSKWKIIAPPVKRKTQPRGPNGIFRTTRADQ